MKRAAALAWLCLAAAVQAEPRRSGFDFMTPATQAMQRDDTLNPGMLWVAGGEQQWTARPRPDARSCAGCHGGVATLRGVAARYPAFDTASGQPVTLGQRINLCRQRHQQAPALAPESAPLLGLSALIGLQSRALPIAPPADARLAPFVDLGRQLYRQRIGQLDFSCAQCHDDHAGRRLAGSVIPQAHPTGYPLYRLEWQALGSLQRRLRGCMSGVRAEPFAFDAPELVALELYLMRRAAGLAVDTPAVRP